MFKIIRKKTLKELKERIKILENQCNCERRWKDIAEQNEAVALELRQNSERQLENLEKKVKDQREVIVNMMILIDFFSQKLLRKHNKKGGKK